MVLLTKEKSCVDCRYYLGREYVCMKLWRTACIRDEWVAAKECKDFVEGIYDEDLIEKEYWENL